MQAQPLTFNGVAKTTPAGVLKGNFKCTVMPQGIHFQQGKSLEFLIPVGTRAEHVKENRIRLHLPEYQLELTVARPGSFQNRLARDLVPFLNGQAWPPQPDAYKMPPYLWVIALLPIGIVVTSGGGAIPGGIAGMLVGVNYGLLQQEQWPLGARIGGALAMTAVGYAFVITLVVQALGSMPR